MENPINFYIYCIEATSSAVSLFHVSQTLNDIYYKAVQDARDENVAVMNKSTIFDGNRGITPKQAALIRIIDNKRYFDTFLTRHSIIMPPSPLEMHAEPKKSGKRQFLHKVTTNNPYLIYIFDSGSFSFKPVYAWYQEPILNNGSMYIAILSPSEVLTLEHQFFRMV